MNALAAAIITKAASSDFLNAIGGRFRNGRAEDGEQYPYCVFLLPVSADPVWLSTFTEDIEDLVIQFSIFSALHAPSEAWTIHGYLNALFEECTLTITGSNLIHMARNNTTYIPEDHTVLGGLQRVHHVAVDYRIIKIAS